MQESGEMALLDGDKIAALAVVFIKEQLAVVALGDDEVSVGVVQTAYANGASTVYMQDATKLKISFVPTGPPLPWPLTMVHAWLHGSIEHMRGRGRRAGAGTGAGEERTSTGRGRIHRA